MSTQSQSSASQPQYRPYIGGTFSCCNIYGRLNLNAEKTAYQGRCYKCGRFQIVKIEK